MAGAHNLIGQAKVEASGNKIEIAYRARVPTEGWQDPRPEFQGNLCVHAVRDGGLPAACVASVHSGRGSASDCSKTAPLTRPDLCHILSRFACVSRTRWRNHSPFMRFEIINLAVRGRAVLVSLIRLCLSTAGNTGRMPEITTQPPCFSSLQTAERGAWLIENIALSDRDPGESCKSALTRALASPRELPVSPFAIIRSPSLLRQIVLPRSKRTKLR